MAGVSDIDKPHSGSGNDIPRMVGESDLRLIDQICQVLPESARIIEFGPWLGGVTQELARFGDVHVVDRFIWSEFNADAYPGVLNAGDDFVHLFQDAMTARGFNPTIHRTEFKDFEWTGEKIDFAFIDSPRNAKQLMQCLLPICDALHEGAHVLVKNAMNPKYAEMMSLVEVLVGQGIFDVVQCDQPIWNTCAYLRPGEALRKIHHIRINADFFSTSPMASGVQDAWGGRMLGAARMAECIARSDWVGAMDKLSEVPKDPEYLYAWDRFEAQLANVDETRMTLAAFAEILGEQVDPPPPDVLIMEASLPCSLRAWWRNTQGLPWRATALVPEILEQARLEGALSWPEKLADSLLGAKVIEIGPDLNYAGVGFCTAGATEYLGLETHKLNPLMIQIESMFPPVTYLPLASIKDEMATGVTAVLVHEPAPEQASEVGRAVSSLRKVLPKEVAPLLLQENGKARPYIQPNGT